MANLFATASTSETQGLTVIEAMAASLPVLAIDDESFRTVVVDELNGFLFKNKEDYQNKVHYYIENKQELKNMKKQARNSSQIHSSKYFAERVLEVYKKAIEENNEDGGDNKTFVGRVETIIKKGFRKNK